MLQILGWRTDVRVKIYGVRPSVQATQCNQHLSIDYGLLVQSLGTESSRVKHLQGLHGEACDDQIRRCFTLPGIS